MATKKITELNQLAGADIDQNSDVLAIVDLNNNETKKVTVGALHSGSFSGSYIGDGSGLTGTSAFPFTGDAQISGSLLISGSIEIDSFGDNNIIIGSGSGEVLSSGTNNIIFGNNAATNLTTGNSNLIIGHRAGRSTALNIESGNTIIGIGAGEDGTYLSDYGDNTFIGYNAGKGSAAQYSVFVGSGVGQGTTTFSVGMGANGTLSCTAAASVAIGYNSQTNGSNNYNVSVGASALLSNNGGSINTNNVAIGYQAGYTSYRLNGNIFIGHKTGYNTGTGDGNIIIGSGSLGDSTMNDQLRIGNGNSLVTISASLATGDVIFANTASAPNFSGSFQGDGTNLNLASNTTIPSAGAFPFNGDAVISGSLLISASEQTASLILKSSGSTILDVRGSLGSMFSVTDSFDGNLFEVNNISGISLLSVSSSGDVDIPKGSLTVSGGLAIEGITDVSASIAAAGGGGGDAFPFIGDAQITGSLLISGSTSLGIENFHIGDRSENTAGTTIVIGNDAKATTGNYRNVVIGNSTTVGGAYRSVLIGESIDAPINHGVVIGDRADATVLGSISIGSLAGNGVSSQGINIGYQAKGSGVSNIVLNSSYLSVTPTKANTFGIYMTGASPNFEIEATGSSTLSGSSFTIEKSGSTVFSVVGSTGTLFEVDDSLEGIIFTANDSTGAPSFQVSSSGELFLGKSPQSLYTTKQIASTISTATESIFSMTTSSLLTTLAFDYSCVSESNARAGTINSVFIPGTDLITFSETATSDIGDTSGVHLSVEITQSQAQFLSKTDSAGWRIKSIIRSI